MKIHERPPPAVAHEHDSLFLLTTAKMIKKFEPEMETGHIDRSSSLQVSGLIQS